MAIKNFKKSFKKWNSVFCNGMVCRTNVRRDIVVVSIAIIVATVFLFVNIPRNSKNESMKSTLSAGNSGESTEIIAKDNSQNTIMTEADISTEVEKIINSTDLSIWKKFSNQFWGFTVKYPGGWLSPKSQSKSAESKWEARYQFRKNDTEENLYLGFDVVVYDVPKTKEISNTDEFPSLKNEELKAETRCQNIEGHAIDIDDFPAEEIYIPPTDDCYNPALFFSITRDQYIYNIVPILRAGAALGADPRLAINDQFPEYYAATSALGLIDIVRPKPTPPKPKITAPKPVSYKVVGGKLVCAKKNDKPRKSKQNKGKHLDMECCLDPDEYPNSWCTY